MSKSIPKKYQFLGTELFEEIRGDIQNGRCLHAMLIIIQQTQKNIGEARQLVGQICRSLGYRKYAERYDPKPA